jgi:DNA-binding NarL/FixJ family response regulator
MKLLLIEDQTMIRQLLVIACRQAMPDAEVLGAASGTEGVVLCEREQPDVVLLDLVLPDCDGLDLVATLRAKVAAVKILILSSHADEYTVHRVQQSGVNGFVDKNDQAVEVLKEALQEVLAGRSYFCSVTRDIQARMRADTKSFSKLLSDREMELLVLFGRGLSNHEIGEKLDLRPNTVRNHRQNIMTKLELGSTPQLIHYALEKGFTRSGR